MALRYPNIVVVSAAVHEEVISQALEYMIADGIGFSSVVEQAFINRDLSNADVRKIIEEGLTETDNDLNSTPKLFNVPDSEIDDARAFLLRFDLLPPGQKIY